MNYPIKKIRIKNVYLDVFENQAQVNGKQENILCIKITRGYCGNNDKWKYVPHYRKKDIEDIKQAIKEYEEWVSDYES